MLTTEVVPMLWRRRGVFLAAALATLAAVVALTVVSPRVYTSSTYLLVTPDEAAGSDFAATQLTQVLTRTYSELLQADTVRAEVERRVGRATPEIRVAPVPQSQLVSIEADGATPAQARTFARTYADVSTERVATLNRRDQTNGRVAVVEQASTPTSPTRPRPVLYIAVGAVLALAAGLAAALLVERIDERLRVRARATEVLGLPILGRLPEPGAGPAAMAQAARQLVANLVLPNLGQRPRSLAVVPADSERDGTSTCALSLARAQAELGSDVILVDARRRVPAMAHAGLDDDRAPALGEPLFDPTWPYEDHLVSIPGSRAKLLVAGHLSGHGGEHVDCDRFRGLAERLATDFDCVVYDAPPAGAGGTVVAAHAQATVLLIDADAARGTLGDPVERLRRAGANLLGVVFDGVGDGRPGRSRRFGPAATAAPGSPSTGALARERPGPDDA